MNWMQLLTMMDAVKTGDTRQGADQVGKITAAVLIR